MGGAPYICCCGCCGEGGDCWKGLKATGGGVMGEVEEGEGKEEADGRG